MRTKDRNEMKKVWTKIADIFNFEINSAHCSGHDEATLRLSRCKTRIQRMFMEELFPADEEIPE